MKAFFELDFYVYFYLLHLSYSLRDYVRGDKVRLRINELELSTKFLGASKEITLREADAVILGVIRTPTRKQT